MDNNVKAGVGILVLKGDQILLGQRNPDPKKASSELHGEGTWTMPGGKIHFGERAVEAASRELLEETGMRANKLEMVSLTDEITDNAHFVTIGFLCRNYRGEPQVREPSEITQWKFFPRNSLPTPMFAPSLNLLQNYNKGIIYKGE
jgi:8-oxo-dGTP diphosphatase